MICTLVPAGCVHFSPRSDVAVSAAERSRIRERVAIEFAVGALYKPRGDAMGGVESELAPLIIQQVAAGSSAVAARDRFGLVVRDTLGQVGIDVTQPTVYTVAGTVEIDGDEYSRVVYLWFYPSDPASRGHARCQVVTLTLDLDGFPAVMEVARFGVGPAARCLGNSRPRILFVSDSAEHRAKERFGSPLVGRTYSIERDVRGAPNTVVARVIEDGPIPMGPFVYLESPALEVTTLLCRCSPSQVDEIVETRYYDLVPVEHLPATVAERLETWTESRRFEQSPGTGTAPANLADVLRWPGLSP